MRVKRGRLIIASVLVGSLLGVPWAVKAAPPIPDLPTKPEFDDSAPVTLNADGSFAFPLRVWQEDIIAGLGGTDADSRWCYWASSNCHHDYNAADILISTGTPIVAPAEGMVVKAGPNNGDRNLTVKLQVGTGMCYLFMHMLPDSLAVGVGDTVAQGQLIGRVGTADDAINKRTGRGTIPHLHLEYNNCSSGGKEDVQPVLKDAFERLPSREQPPPPPAPTSPPPPPVPESVSPLDIVGPEKPPMPAIPAPPTTTRPVVTPAPTSPPPPPMPESISPLYIVRRDQTPARTATTPVAPSPPPAPVVTTPTVATPPSPIPSPLSVIPGMTMESP